MVTTATFRPKSLPVVECALARLEAERPMTLRQLYYRVVSAGVLANEPREYNRLKTIMGRLREAGDVPRSWIVDHVRTTLKPSSWSGLADFGDTVRHAYRKDFWEGLEVYLEVLVEKDAVAGTIQPVTERYDVALRVLRGYSSISFAGEIADLWSQIDKPIHAYFLGDFDPSGLDIERDVREKVARYGGGDFEWTRLAIEPADFDEFDLIRLPVKRSDRRAQSFMDQHGRHCAELDALPPSELRRRVEQAILGHIDPAAWERLQRVEEVERATMQDYIDRWSDAEVNLDTVER